ncbi:MAG: hypothetical protein PWP31_356 [Clostridia bacterium]|nr:hypothetical protein [Clostridia bacterium]
MSLAYFLIFTGIILVIIFGFPLLRQFVEDNSQDTIEERLTDLQIELENIANKLKSDSRLVDQNTENSNSIFQKALENVLSKDRDPRELEPLLQEKKELDSEPVQSTVDSDTNKLNDPKDLKEEIKKAYAEGETIDSLARRFGRGKGEIELIINLNR